MEEESSELFQVARIVKCYMRITNQDVPVSWDVIETVSVAISEGANFRLFKGFLHYFDGKEDIGDFFYVLERFKFFLCIPVKGVSSLNDFNYDGLEEYIDGLVNSGRFKWGEE